MSRRIIIERLEFQGHCGVTPEERERPQMLAVDLELELPTEQAGQSDHLAQTVDYATVAELETSLDSYFWFYNHERPHQSLAYRTPAEVHFS